MAENRRIFAGSACGWAPSVICEIRVLCLLVRDHACRQVLGVRAVDANEVGVTAGSAVNLLAVDAQRLMDTAGSLHELWGLPFQVRCDSTFLLYPWYQTINKLGCWRNACWSNFGRTFRRPASKAPRELV